MQAFPVYIMCTANIFTVVTINGNLFQILKFNIYMKRFYYCLFFIVAAAVLSFSCTSENGRNEEYPEPEIQIKLSDKDVSAGPEGGDFTLYYSITNPVEGENVKLMTEEGEWITAVNGDVFGIITFSVLQNEGKEQRQGTVLLQYSDITETITVTQEGHGNPTADDIKGVWTVVGDRWDLDSDSICYLMDDDSEDGFARDEDGNYITVTIREYCQQYADDYNADPANEMEGTAEDFAYKVYDDLGLAGTITVDGGNILFDWGLAAGFSATMVDGTYEYNAVKGYMTVDDRANASDPRMLQVDVFEDENGMMCFSYPEYYIVGVSSYDKTREYWVYATTVFYCEKSENE